MNGQRGMGVHEAFDLAFHLGLRIAARAVGMNKVYYTESIWNMR